MPVTINENVAYGLDTRLSVRPGYDNAAGMLGDISGVMSVFKRAISAARQAGGPYLDIEDRFLELGPELAPAAGNSTSFNNAAQLTAIDVSPTGVVPSSGAVLVRFTVSGYVAGSARVIVYGTGMHGFTDSFTANGVYERVVPITTVGGSANQAIRFQATSASVTTLTISVDSVREILSADVFQDSAGTIPAAIGSTVGLLTDRSFGGELGAELAGVFGDASKWSLPANTSMTADGLVFDGAADLAQVITNPAVSPVVTRSCQVTYTIDQYTSGSVRLLFGGAGITRSAAGTYSEVLTAADATSLRLQSRAAGTTLRISNISVRELRGNHATQATAGNRPVLTTHNGKPILSFDPTNDSLSVPIPFGMADDQCVVVGAIAGTSDANARRLFEVTGVSGTEIFLAVTMSTGLLHAQWKDSAAKTRALPFGGAIVLDQPFVAAIRKTGNLFQLRLNGVVVASATDTMGAMTPTSAAIGNRPAGDRAFGGLILPVFMCKSITDAQLIAVERGMAQKLGVTYA